jgi:hypothetical protein
VISCSPFLIFEAKTGAATSISNNNILIFRIFFVSRTIQIDVFSTARNENKFQAAPGDEITLADYLLTLKYLCGASRPFDAENED